MDDDLPVPGELCRLSCAAGAPAGEHVFRRRGGNGQGHLSSSLRHQGAFQRLRWWETAPIHMALFGLGLLASL